MSDLTNKAVTPYTLASSSVEDRPWLDQLRRDAYRDLFDATWGAWDEARHQRHLAASIEQGNIKIIQQNGLRVGMLQLVDHHDATEVAEIQIRPEAQGKGLGTAVLNGVIQEARSQLHTVHLSTGLRNEGALRLYLRMGFRLVATSETHFHLRIP